MRKANHKEYPLLSLASIVVDCSTIVVVVIAAGSLFSDWSGDQKPDRLGDFHFIRTESWNFIPF